MPGKTLREALQEARNYRDPTNEGGPGSGPQKGGKKQSSADIKKAYGILNDPRYKQGNYSGAAKAIDKLSPGLSNHPDVKNAMKRANEELDETMVVTKVDKDTNSPAYQKFKAGDKRYVYKENLDLSATGDTTTSNASQEVETVELDEAQFTPAQVSSLMKAYGDFSSTGVSMKNMDKLKATMKRYSKDHLNQLAKLDIPMVSKVAKELTEAVVGLPFSRTLMYIIKTDRNTATRIKSFLADNGEKYPIHIDDDGSGQITLDAYNYTGGEKKAALAAAQAIAKKFNVKVNATR